MVWVLGHLGSARAVSCGIGTLRAASSDVGATLVGLALLGPLAAGLSTSSGRLALRGGRLRGGRLRGGRRSGGGALGGSGVVRASSVHCVQQDATGAAIRDLCTAHGVAADGGELLKIDLYRVSVKYLYGGVIQ